MTSWRIRKSALLSASLLCTIAATFLVAAMFVGEDAEENVFTIPHSDTIVLELSEQNDPGSQLALQRQNLFRTPDDPRLASEYAASALRQYAGTADARFLGLAAGALQPWDGEPSPPEDVWILRGRLLQTQHQFSAAASDLDALLAVYDRSIEATMLSADAWRRAGDIGRARARCVAVALRGRADLAAYCAADIYLSLDLPDKAAAAIRHARQFMQKPVTETDQWALTVAADVAAASGDYGEAIALYRTARDLPDASVALHVSLADLLLKTGMPQDALDSLDGLPDADAVVLRRSMALKALGSKEFSRLRTQLRQRFEAEDALGNDGLHDRERALVALHLDSDPDRALRFARANWRRQKGREDAEILIDAANAAGRQEAAADVTRWRDQYLQGED